MSLWHISLMGGLKAERAGHSVTRFRTRKTASLLAYLAFRADRAHPRDELVDLLWPEDDPEDARASFRTALNSLRNQLEPPPVASQSVIFADRFAVRLQADTVTTDVSAFMTAITRARSASDPNARAQHLSFAIQSYGGELLPGFYEDWVLTEREYLVQLYLDAMRQLTEHAESDGNLSQALECAQLLVCREPTSDVAHLAVMRLYRKAGRPKDALQQYQELERISREYFDAEPSDESRLLAESIRSAAHQPVVIARPRRQIRISAGSLSCRLPIDSRRDPVATPPSLPVPTMPFFGREEEIAHIEEIVLRRSQPRYRGDCNGCQGVRLLTLLGPGGSGKTRIAIEVARRMQRPFNNAVWFVSLADLSVAIAIPPAILDAMALSRQATGNWIETIKAQLANRAGLLVLDNFEHLAVDGARYVQELQSSLPSLVCVTTSRVKINIDGERTFRVTQLPTPTAEQVAPVDLVEYPSVRLFVDRAQCARPDFQVTPANAEAVGELCRRLEGLPLALELAASWSMTLTPHQMLERTKERLSLVTTRRSGGIERHRSLRAAVEWSYRLLSPWLRLLFQRLSVFRGGWNVSSAICVCAGLPDADTTSTRTESEMLMNLTVLAEASLIVTEEVDVGSGPQIRFRMLETLREFASEQLSDDDNIELCRSHLEWMASWAQEIGMQSLGTQQVDALEKAESELDNVRAALLWSSNDDESCLLGLQLMHMLTHFWCLRGNYEEVLSLLVRFLSHPAAQDATNIRLGGLALAGTVANYISDWEMALGYHQEMLSVARKVGDTRRAADALMNLGSVAERMDDIEGARGYYKQSLKQYEEAGFVPGIASAHGAFAGLASRSGDLELALSCLIPAISLLRQERSLSGVTHHLLQLANIYGGLKDFDNMRLCMIESIQGYRELKDLRGLAALFADLVELLPPSATTVRLFGAACTINANTGASPLYLEQFIARSRIAMGDAAFDSSWNEGCALKYEQAIKIALYILGSI